MERLICVTIVLMNLYLISVHAASLSSSGADQWAKHHNYEEMLAVLDAVHRKCPDITYLYNLTGHPDSTIQGRRLAVLIISDQPDQHEVGELMKWRIDFQVLRDRWRLLHQTVEGVVLRT